MARGRVQGAFLSVLRSPGVCVIPPDWDEGWGVGRVDLLALLQAPLPAVDDLEVARAFGAVGEDPVDRLAAIVGTDPTLVRARLSALLDARSAGDLAALLAAHEGELAYLTMVDDGFAAALAAPAVVGAFAPTTHVDGVTRELAARLSR